VACTAVEARCDGDAGGMITATARWAYDFSEGSRDMQDTEFTIEDGRLHMLQTRSAKRPAQAAVRFAVDAVREGLLTPAEALLTIDAQALDALLHPTFDPTALAKWES
jgi:phosphoenolpyruvate synthase/pyruvate phosphate dikinase